MNEAIGVYRIEMDGRWDFWDLYEFPHAFIQLYAFTYCFDSELSPLDADRINYALENYPWLGGYSIVNIYRVLQNQIKVEQRPQIAEIKYASPGWIDLFTNLYPAVKIASSVAAIAGSIAATTKAYSAIQKTLSDIRLQRDRMRLQQIQLSRAQVNELTALTQDLSRLIGFNKIEELNTRTGSIEVTAKLVSAQFRRLKILVDYVIKGKAYLPPHPRE
ncbi:MAG: hypothetical protein C4583_05760 [Anaerolineaceae bacterium]|nr:MAG: hypothetical protein C4583_05760 [Anaerolineaceae bacterium]